MTSKLPLLLAATEALSGPAIGGMRTRFDRMPKQEPPKPGEWVLSCGHGAEQPMTLVVDVGNPTTWFEFVDPVTGAPGIEINSPDGTLKSRWLTVCASCLRAAGNDPRKVTLRDHFRYVQD